MKISRRDALAAALFGGSMVGLRSLATGLPVKFLMNPKKALADMADGGCPNMSQAQYVVMCTSYLGDPISCDAPGTYNDPNTNIDLSSLVHPDGGNFPAMAPVPMMIGGKGYTAAGVWNTLPASVLKQTAFCHIMTNTPVHPHEPEVLGLMGAAQNAEKNPDMFPSVLAEQLAPCLGTLQPQPIAVGAVSPSESLTYQGQALPTIPPTSLAATLTNRAGQYANMTGLQSLRDSTLNNVYDWYDDAGQTTPAQRAFVDSLVISQNEARGISQNQLLMLQSITANDNNGQITAAIALILMGVAPVITVHFPFGGDNHADPLFATEAADHVTGVAALASLMSQIQGLPANRQACVISLNVFGRTMAAYNTAGRQHNQFHQMSLMMGSPFKGGVIGGIAPLDSTGTSIIGTNNALFDYGSLPFDPQTGIPTLSSTDTGAIQPLDSLASFGATVLTAVGVPSGTVSNLITDTKAQVIQAALA